MNQDTAYCEICGEPMPKGEEMFKFHGYSGPCPKNTLRKGTATTHPELVKSLCKSGKEIALNMTYHEAHMIHMVLGISGEAGELLDAVKKNVIYHKPLDKQNIIEELGDLEFYMEGLRQGLGITRGEVLEQNITKLTKRYGEKYSDQAAQARADKVDAPIHDGSNR